MIEEIKGNVVAAKGFEAAGVCCGVKTEADTLDLGIIFSQSPSVAAATFTTNEIKAAPIRFCQKNITNGRAQAIVVNSGNANACTGERGMRDAAAMAESTAQHLTSAGLGDLSGEDVLVASTGIIGHPLPMDKIAAGIKQASSNLGNADGNAQAIARAIMTTDTKPKEIAVKTRINGREVIIGCVTKGAGMIAPKMATMLCFITTDVSISANSQTNLLQQALSESVDKSFNRITVDGHTSTNDMVAILANGMAGNATISSEGDDFKRFKEALDYVAIDLAKKIVKDGEGATKFVEIEVVGAKSESDAREIAHEIANSALVKTAINGEDPNWGRIVSAAGYAGIPLQEDRVKLHIGGTLIFENGLPVSVPEGDLSNEMKRSEIYFRLDLGLGDARTVIWTCDLSHEYVTINAEYHT